MSPHCQQIGHSVLLYSVFGKHGPIGSLTLYIRSVAAFQPCPSFRLHHQSPSSLTDLWWKSFRTWRLLPKCQHVCCQLSCSFGLLTNVWFADCQAPYRVLAVVSATSSSRASLSVFLHTKSRWRLISHSLTLSANAWVTSLLILCSGNPEWAQWAKWAMTAALYCRGSWTCCVEYSSRWWSP
jgi:hypothetical protein